MIRLYYVLNKKELKDKNITKERNFMKMYNGINIVKIKQNGITLIALVVTIIILMILSGISISMITGPNRNFTTYRKSK